MESHKYLSVDEYIHLLPDELKEKAHEIRTLLRETVPDAQEVISYNMPAYKNKKVLFYFALYKNHVGFYPTGDGINAFQDKLKGYKFSKGAIQFPVNEPLPEDLIRQIALYRSNQVALTSK